VIDIHAAMANLAAPRPLFHSAADFQHALAWRLQQQHPRISIRLEYRYPHLPKYGYIPVARAAHHRWRSEVGCWRFGQHDPQTRGGVVAVRELSLELARLLACQ
jgi:hypothetical protein